MAKSKSKKKLEHRLKNDLGYDPRNKRGDFGDLTGITQKTPTLLEKKRKQNNKHKKKYSHGNDDYTSFNISKLA